MEKKCKTEKRKEEVGLAASRSTQASQPSQPHHGRLPARAVAAGRPNSRATAQLAAHRVAHPRALLLRPQPLPAGPRVSAAHPSTVSSSSPTPQPPTRPAPDSGGRAGQGSRPGHGPVSLAPHPRNPCAAPTPPHASQWMPLITPQPLDRRPPLELGARL